jgi:hypothetical protein
MNSSTLRTLSGSALVAAAAGCLAGGLLHPVVSGHAHSAEALLSPGEAIGSSALLIGTVLLLLGLPGVYGWLATRLGRIGFVGFLLYFVGNLLSSIPHLVVMTTIGPEVARRAPDLISEHDMIISSPAFELEQTVSGFTLVAGLALLSIALVRRSDLRWIGSVGLLGVVVMFVPLPAMPVLSGLQIELARGVLIAALGVAAIRSSRGAHLAAQLDTVVSRPARVS